MDHTELSTVQGHRVNSVAHSLPIKQSLELAAAAMPLHVNGQLPTVNIGQHETNHFGIKHRATPISENQYLRQARQYKVLEIKLATC
jgi:hypothetical protein